jgi:Uma2 family endonuclease
MSQVLSSVISSLDPQPRRWTKHEFHLFADLGLFHGQCAELIEGDIMVLSPQGPSHYATVQRISRVLGVLLGDSFDIRPLGPLDLGTHSEPEPDIAVVMPSADGYATVHPHSAVLVIEVSDTTLASDRSRKGSLFARFGLTDYWIANLVADQLEVYRNPVRDAAQPCGHRYDQLTILRPGTTISPLAAPTVVIPVADLFPPPSANSAQATP